RQFIAPALAWRLPCDLRPFVTGTGRAAGGGITMNEAVDNDIDCTLHGVETLYRSLTGGPPPNGQSSHSAIPPEVDPNHHVNAQLDRLIAMLDPRVLETPPQFTPQLDVWEALDEYVM